MWSGNLAGQHTYYDYKITGTLSAHRRFCFSPWKDVLFLGALED